MNELLGRGIKAIIIIAMVFVGVLGAVLGFLYSPFFRYPTHGEYPPPGINELIWPTIGYPAMVVPGGVLEIEVDLWIGEETRHEEVSGWRASLAPVREELAGLDYELEPAGARLGASERWPYRSTEGRSEAVWHVSFRVPQDVAPELYDLRVEVDAYGEHISDGQPHSVAVTADDDNDFTYITLSDIHVHERNNSAPLSIQTDKGIAEDGEPLFFEEAIAQVNLIRPDFVIMLGDFVRGQRRPGELLSEYEKFYRALLELEVPAFLLPGNHDQYINEIDGARWYENNLGPLYYSFDVGDCHFTCLDSYQWPQEDRLVMNKLLYMEPRKYQGQVLGEGGGAGMSAEGDQLAWAEEDLEANAGAPLRVMALHHDPYTQDGKGYAYVEINYYGIFHAGGGGEGREALLDLAADYNVDAVFGGHLHEDRMGEVAWEEGGGETVYSCQTCVYFDAGGRSGHYPGYRLVEVDGGEITSLSYLNGVSSYPFYDGSVPEGTTDLDALERPALQAEVYGGETGETELGFTLSNYLAEDMKLAGLVAPVPESPSGNYSVEGGEVYNVVAIPSRPGWVLLYIETDVPPSTTTINLGSGLQSTQRDRYPHS